ncbi:MAG: exo-alpha-sialidase [Chthoniobacteraceae bacterium]
MKLAHTLGFATMLLAQSGLARAAAPATVEFTVKLETVMSHDDGKFLWFHPRAAAIPSPTGGEPAVVMTIQKHLKVSDYYSGLHFMIRPSLSAPWKGPTLPAELDWRAQPGGVTVSVADVTPGWHAPTGRLLAIGCEVRYSPEGRQLDDVKRAHRTVYAVFDPKTEKWTPWQVLELPPEEQFDFARNACAQWLVKPDGALLVPLYIGRNSKEPFSTTVAECRFDGAKLTCVSHGTVLRLPVARGLYEPSLVAFRGRYFLTLRNDVRGYVSVSEDGRNFAEPKPWLFDDGADLGSYNTQQHWLAHGGGLFLIYTRRGANNDHIVRHRAPLFMAQVDPETLRVMRGTEKIVVPERGAELGNFGACAISSSESWVTVSEGMFMKDSSQRGAAGTTFVARIIWSKPDGPGEASDASPGPK